MSSSNPTMDLLTVQGKSTEVEKKGREIYQNFTLDQKNKSLSFYTILTVYNDCSEPLLAVMSKIYPKLINKSS